MGISPEAKNPKSAPPKSKEDAAKTMATTENKLTKQKRVADKVRNEKRKIADEERAFKLLMKQAGKRTDAGKAELAKGGMIGRKKKTGDARKVHPMIAAARKRKPDRTGGHPMTPERPILRHKYDFFFNPKGKKVYGNGNSVRSPNWK